jgi:hypothetical protein
MYPDEDTDDDGRDTFQDEPLASVMVQIHSRVLTTIANHRDLLDQT